MGASGLLLSVLSILVLFFYLLILVLPVALLVALQVWLCKKSLKLGLILPGISLALSLVLVLNIAAFGALTVTAGSTPVTSIEGGAVQVPAQEEYHEVPAPEEYVEVPAQEGVPRGEGEQKVKREFHPEALAAVVVVFLVSNIPTAVFGGIWLHYKGRKDALDDLKRMRIEDLE